MRSQISVKTLLLAVSIGLIGVSAPAHAGNDTSWIPTDKNYAEPTVHSFAFTDKLALPFVHSVLQGSSQSGATVCKSTSDTACASKNSFQFTSILKACTTAADTDCISEVSAFDSSGTATKAKFSNYTVSNHLNAFPADSALGIPDGGSPSIWSIPSAPHASGSEYAVIAGINGQVDRTGNTWAQSTVGNFMQIALVPVVLKDFGQGRQSIAAGWNQSIAGVYYDYCANSKQTDGTPFVDCAHVNGDACIFPTNDQGKCYAEVPFGTVQKFNVQLNLAKEPTGWMHGRMIDPAISITKSSTGGVNLSVTAGATSVPMVYQTAPWASLSAKMKDLWVKCNSSQQSCSGFWLARAPGATSSYIELSKTMAGNADINMIKYVDPFGAQALEIMATIAPLVDDKSALLSSTWSMRTLSNLEMNGSNACFTSTPGLKGIVTTNSTVYSAGPPAFKDDSLNYQVAAPHFNPDGVTAFKGNYNLVMRSDVARCIYGFSKAPISASISIVSADGNNDVATTIAAEKDGWLSLSANNFQFSSPIIQVKLTQDAPAAEASPEAVKPVAPAPKPKKTITCVKGKTTKKVTGTNPACPKGYKKK
jgi:hypothetical protein